MNGHIIIKVIVSVIVAKLFCVLVRKLRSALTSSTGLSAVVSALRITYNKSGLTEFESR